MQQCGASSVRCSVHAASQTSNPVVQGAVRCTSTLWQPWTRPSCMHATCAMQAPAHISEQLTASAASNSWAEGEDAAAGVAAGVAGVVAEVVAGTLMEKVVAVVASKTSMAAALGHRIETPSRGFQRRVAAAVQEAGQRAAEASQAPTSTFSGKCPNSCRCVHRSLLTPTNGVLVA